MNAALRAIVVTGLSGSGKTTALHVLEDLGFYCIDNLPVALLPRFVELWGVPPAWVRALLPAEREVHESLPMTLGAKPRVEQGELRRTGRHHRGSGRWPAGHRRIDLSRLEGIEATHANLGRAERLLRYASRNESAWTDLTEGDLRAVASWLRDIGIGQPWLEIEVPDDAREAWCAREPALRGIEVTVMPKRRQSRLR